MEARNLRKERTGVVVSNKMDKLNPVMMLISPFLGLRPFRR